MQAWQIKALELEMAGLEHLEGFIHEHALGFLTGAIGLLLALLAWVLSGALRRKGGISHGRLVIFIRLPGPPPPPRDTFDPFPPPHHSAYDDHRDDYARYAEQIPIRMISANADSLATVQELHEEIAMIAKKIETRDVNITNHATKTDELCRITQAKCNETVTKVELLVKSLGAHMDTQAIVRGIKYSLESGINREIIAPFLKSTEELANQVVPTLEKVEKASSAAASSWGQRIWSAAIWHGVTAGVLVALVIGFVMYDKFSDYYERNTAEQIAYAERVMNYNQAAFRQLAIAQVPVKVLRAEESGIINRGFVLEVHNADSVETRVEDGQTNGYVYFSSNLTEKQIQLLQQETEKQMQSINGKVK